MVGFAVDSRKLNSERLAHAREDLTQGLDLFSFKHLPSILWRKDQLGLPLNDAMSAGAATQLLALPSDINVTKVV
jgi:hypothetical protein